MSCTNYSLGPTWSNNQIHQNPTKMTEHPLAPQFEGDAAPAELQPLQRHIQPRDLSLVTNLEKLKKNLIE